MDPNPLNENAAQKPINKMDFKFTPEEIRVIAECNKESFFQRCIPLGTLMGLGTLYAVKSGYIKSSPRWGAFPKVTLAVTLGYFIGKFSYQQKCAEKLMELPNSRLGEMLRQRRKGVFREAIDPSFGPTMSLAPFSDMPSQESYSDFEPHSSQIDTYKPIDDFSDSNFKDLRDEIKSEKGDYVTNYEELRRKNREEYQKNRGINYKGYVDPNPPVENNKNDDSNVPISEKKNKYGDSWGL